MRNPKDPGWPDRGERTTEREIADRWKWAYVDLMRDGHRRRVLGGKRSRKLGPAAKEYLEHRENTRERATWLADRTAIGHLTAHLSESRALATVATEDVQAMMDSMLREGYEPTTLYTYLKSIGIFLRWAGYDITRDVRLPSVERPDVRYLVPAEANRAREAALRVDRTQVGHFPSARLAVEIGLSMGLRQGEIFGLRWEDIDPADKSVRVSRQVPKDRSEPKGLKGDRARTAGIMEEWWPLHREGATGYIVGRNGRPVGTRTQRNLITRVLDVSGLNETGMGWHVLRHAYSAAFLARGGVIQELQKSLGHSSVTTTERIYGHFRGDTAWALARARIYDVS